MFTIQELTDRENILIGQVHGVVGSMEEKALQLTDNGVFNSYRKLHSDYASLAWTGNIEALKRAFFIQWYANAEPACFTGIHELDKDIEIVVFDQVAKLINLDDELKWMTAWYYLITDNYFEPFWSNPSIIKSLQSYIQEIGSLTDQAILSDEPLENRGQMGVYFISVLKSNRSRAK